MVDIYFRTYPFLFTAGIQDLSLAEEAITKTEMGMILLSTWRNSQLKNIVLTSVGTAIAASYYCLLYTSMLYENKADSPYHKFMPQLAGTPAEIDALRDYLFTLTQDEKQ